MAENVHLENGREEMHETENIKNKHTSKQQKHTLKMTEQKMNDMENGRKCTYWKMAEFAHPENNRT